MPRHQLPESRDDSTGSTLIVVSRLLQVASGDTDRGQAQTVFERRPLHVIIGAMREPKDDHERKAIADVQNHGWHVLKVMGDSEGPAFAYTVGLYHSFGQPELIVVGLPLDVGHSVLNIAGESIRRGVRYSEGTRSDEFLEDRACTFRRMPESQYRHYLGWNLWFYNGSAFPALQMIWADQDGPWPWDAKVDPVFRERQPVIDDQGDPPWAPQRTE